MKLGGEQHEAEGIMRGTRPSNGLSELKPKCLEW